MGAFAAPIAIASAIGGTALTAFGQMQQTSAAAGQAKYQAAVARNNQTLAERAAADARERGRVAELNQRLATKQLAGRQRASFAANGVDVGSGSVIDVITDTFKIGETDALTIRANAEREALGYQAQGMNFAAEAGAYDAQRRNIRASLPFEMAGTVLAGAGQVADTWYNFNRLRGT